MKLIGQASKRLSRRRLLRGAGTVAIGLPLAGYLPKWAGASPGNAPSRYVSVFYGNGMPKKFTDAGYTGVLAPLARHAPKLAMLRGLLLNEGSGASLHYKGTARFGKGVSAPSQSTAGGESLDNALYVDRGAGTKLLNTNIHTHVTGGNPATRWYHSWRDVSQPNDELLRPLDVFDAIFGSYLNTSDTNLTAEERRAIRYRNSVLDSVVEQYKEIKSERSGYPAGVRALLSDHLELVRSLERRSLDGSMNGELDCTIPAAPADIEPSQVCTPELCPSDDSTYYGSGGANWSQVWELHAELYAMALRCGITRFGTMGCSGGGDRYPIPDLRTQGVTESPHIYAHDWRRSQENGFDLCVHWLMEKMALLLDKLDDPAWPDADGGTVLDNSLILIGTEMGTANDGQHYGDWMTYFLAGGGGRIQSGDHLLTGKSDVDLYSTIARAMNLRDGRFGDPGDFTGHLDIVV